MSTSNRLRRSRRNRVLAGVCGGLAEWLGWDATLVRILYVVVSILSAAFPGILVYLVLWIVMPKGDGRQRGRGGRSAPRKTALWTLSWLEYRSSYAAVQLSREVSKAHC